MNRPARLPGAADALDPEAGRALLLEYEAILENAFIGIAFTRERRVQHCNSRFAEIFGWTREELIGQPGAVFYRNEQDYQEIGRNAGPRLAAGEVFEDECWMARRDGTEIRCLLRAKAVNPDDTAAGTIWIIDDVSERRRQQEQFDSTLQVLEALMDNAPLGIVHSRDGLILRCNEHFAQTCAGQPAVTLVGRRSAEFFASEEEYARLGRRARPRLSIGQPYSGEVLLRRANGAPFWTHSVGYVLDRQQPDRGTFWIIKDISEARGAEEQLRNALQTQDAILDNALTGIVFVRERVIERCNRRLEELFGYAQGEMNGQSTRILYRDQADFEAAAVHYVAIDAGQTHRREQLLMRRDGTQFWSLMNGRAVEPGNPARGYVWLFEDISGRKQAELQLRELLHEHEMIFENAGVGIALQRNRVTVRCNQHLCDLFGHAREALEGQSTRVLFGSQQAWLAAGEKVYSEARRERFEGVFEYAHKTGTPLSCRVTGRKLDDTADGPLWLWIYRDVTGELETQLALLKAKSVLEERVSARTADLAAANDALRDQLSFVEQLIEAMPNPVFYKDTSGRYTGCNRAFTEYLGVPREQLIGKTTYDISPPELAERYHAADRELLENPGTQSYDAAVRYADGSQREVAIYRATFHHADGSAAGIVGSMLDLSERKKAEQALREQSERLRLYFDLPMIGMARLGLHEGWIEINDKLCQIVGYSQQELAARPWMDLVHGDDRAAENARFASTLRGDSDGYEADLRLRRRDGDSIDCHVIMRCVRDNLERLEYFVVMVQDISERKRLEEDLRLSATVFEHAAEGVMIVDTEVNIVAVNRTFTEITGYEEHELRGKNPRILQSGKTSRTVYAKMWRSIQENGFWRGELWNQRKDGTPFAELLTVSAVRNAQGQITHYVGLVSDITSIKRSQEVLDYQAHHDPLTDLPNRLLFEDRLDHALQRCRREHGLLAVMFVDLDRFKNINDTLGHPVGDEVLRAIARRLQGVLRVSDTVARLGGDEFILLLESIDDQDDVAVVADKLLADFREPIPAAGKEFFVTASIGVSLFPRDGDDVATLVRNADAAMYRAKEQGRNGFEFYRTELTSTAQKRFVLEADLRRALERGELHLHYQPQRRIADGRLMGAEVLLRWNRPQHGPVSPADFIPLAEETGLIVDIGKWVLETACAQLQAWIGAGLHPPPLAVNVSEVQMRRGNLLATVENVLKKTGLPPGYLELEITEGFIMHQSDERVSQLGRLRELGVGLAIDDFGTGYSSLSYLKRFPIDTLKIDQSFVRGLPGDADDAAITRAIIAMGRSLGLNIVAEGVELPAQQEFLRLAGCEFMQGYLYARPMPAADFEATILPGPKPPPADDDPH